MAHSVLVVEDDSRIRRVLVLVLGNEGYEVSEASSGEEALAMLDAHSPDVVLLDVMLPGRHDGFAVCRSLRARGPTPVIMLTARTDSHDVVAGLEAGADDYITKPFVPKEVTARIRALLRRTEGAVAAGRRHVGDLEIAEEQGVVSRAGVPVPLTRTEFRLLCELAAAGGRVLSREDLLERVWQYGFFGDGRLVDAHVRRLRTKVERDPSDPQIVLTVRGMGYRIPAEG